MLDFPLTWNEKLTLFLILFSSGLLCILCAILLAIYLIKSDRFTIRPKEEEKVPYPSFEEFEEKSRLSRLKSKIGGFFRRIASVFKRSKKDSEFLELESTKTTEDLPSKTSEEEPNSTDEDSTS